MVWTRMRMTGRYLWMACIALAIILPAVWLLPVMQTPRIGMPRAEEVRYVRVLDGSTGKSFTVENLEQIRTILGCLPEYAGQRFSPGICLPRRSGSRAICAERVLNTSINEKPQVL